MPKAKIKLLLLFNTALMFAAIVSQAANFLVRTQLAVGETRVVNSLLWLTHIRNTGGIFGLLPGQGWIFALFSILLLLATVIYLLLAKNLTSLHYVCLGLIVGGGFSNIFDRFQFGGVIDYIHLQHIPYWNYIFNSADVMIHLGLWPLFLFSLLHSKNNRIIPAQG